MPSFGYLFILAAVRVPRTGERQVRKAPGCTGEWWMHGAKTLSFAARSSESKEEERHGKACLFCMCMIQCVWPRASLPPYLGDRWCEGSLCICFQGPGGVGVGFTNLGKSHYRTPGFWIGKYQALRWWVNCYMNTKFDRFVNLGAMHF